MMINLIEDTIEGIPVLHVVQAEQHEKALPTVLYYHGFNGEKISSLTLAYKLAEQGYRVVLPDCLYHGARRKEMSQIELNLAFWDIVLQTIKEMEILKNNLVQRGLSMQDRIGIGGTSMGGIVTYGALVCYDWLKAATALMGTAYMTDYAKCLIDDFNGRNKLQVSQEEKLAVLEQLAEYDMSLHPNALNDRPLLIWHGEEDKVVPYKYSPAFYESILEYYEDKDNIRFVSEQGRAHHISRLSMSEASDWFGKHL